MQRGMVLLEAKQDRNNLQTPNVSLGRLLEGGWSLKGFLVSGVVACPQNIVVPYTNFFEKWGKNEYKHEN